MTKEEIQKSMKTGVVHWLPFSKDQNICILMGREGSFLQDVRDAVFEWLSDEGYAVAKSDMSAPEKADVILLIGVLEITDDAATVLTRCRENLNPAGFLVIGMNNPFGIRYFIGDKDPFTGRVFDSICAYGGCDDRFIAGKSKSAAFVRQSLQTAGFTEAQCKRFSVFSGIENTQLIYADGILPSENLEYRYFPTYWKPESIFLWEKGLLPDLMKNDLFHPMANAYVYVCAKDKLAENIADIESATVALDRGRVNSGVTVIRNGKEHIVEKAPAYSQGEGRLKKLTEHEKLLSELGVQVIAGEWRDGRYVTSYMENAVSGVDYFINLLERGAQVFLEACDRFRDIVYKAPEFYDLVPWNSFVVYDEFIFYDQEYRDPDFKADALLFRSIVFWSGIGYRAGITMESLLDRYRLTGQEKRLNAEIIKKIDDDLKHYDIMDDFWRERTTRTVSIGDNRDRINYPGMSYEDRFKLPDPNGECDKTFLFGSGLFAKKFINRYGEIYTVSGVLDNASDKWGQTFEGYSILQPEKLKELKDEKIRVIVCVRRHAEIVEQLKSYGITEVYLFDPSVSRIEGKNRINEQPVKKEEEKTEKKYHTGYIAGVFDLFHIGHLNLLRRAKEQCEYLIVGVVSDEGVTKFKQVEPYIPFEERLEIVSSCKYVDEAHKIPLYAAGSIDAWNLYHFDVQFSGSDYENDSFWLDERERLRKVGADMVFFPYTKSTSSTKLKEKLK